MNQFSALVDEIKEDAKEIVEKLEALISKTGSSFHLLQATQAMEQVTQAVENHLAGAKVTSDPVEAAIAATTDTAAGTTIKPTTAEKIEAEAVQVAETVATEVVEAKAEPKAS